MKAIVLAVLLAGVASVEAHAKKKQNPIVDALKVQETFSMTPAPMNEEVCFSPDENCDAKLVKFVMSAKESLDVAIYDINLDKLVHELLVAGKKMKVRIIVDQRQSKGSHSLVGLLLKAGALVKYGKQRSIFHNKFTIVDGKMIETGSYNYTNNATKNNQENQVYLTSPKIVARYKERFEKMWREAKAP